MACMFLHINQPRTNLDFVIRKVFYHKIFWPLAHLTCSLYLFIRAGKALLQILVSQEQSLMIRIKTSLAYLKVLSNLQGFIAPYPEVRYHLHEFRGANRLPQNPQELFNHRHSSLRNVIQRSFNVLKTRSPVLKAAPQLRISCPKGHSCCCMRFENGGLVKLFPPHKYIICTSPGAQSKLVNLE